MKKTRSTRSTESKASSKKTTAKKGSPSKKKESSAKKSVAKPTKAKISKNKSTRKASKASSSPSEVSETSSEAKQKSKASKAIVTNELSSASEEVDYEEASDEEPIAKSKSKGSKTTVVSPKDNTTKQEEYQIPKKVSPSASVSETKEHTESTVSSLKETTEEPEFETTETGTPIDFSLVLPDSWKEENVKHLLDNVSESSLTGKAKTKDSELKVSDTQYDPKGPITEDKLTQLGMKDLHPSDIHLHASTGFFWARRFTPAQYKERSERKKRYGVDSLSPSQRLIPFIVLNENDNWKSYVADFLKWDALSKAPIQKMASGFIKPATYHSKWASFADARLKGNPKAFLVSKGSSAVASISRAKARPKRDEFQTHVRGQEYPAASPHTVPMMGYYNQATSQVAVGGPGAYAWPGHIQQCDAERHRREAMQAGDTFDEFEAAISCFCPRCKDVVLMTLVRRSRKDYNRFRSFEEDTIGKFVSFEDRLGKLVDLHDLAKKANDHCNELYAKLKKFRKFVGDQFHFLNDLMGRLPEVQTVLGRSPEASPVQLHAAAPPPLEMNAPPRYVWTPDELEEEKMEPKDETPSSPVPTPEEGEYTS